MRHDPHDITPAGSKKPQNQMNNKNEIPFFESEQNLIFNGELERT